MTEKTLLKANGLMQDLEIAQNDQSNAEAILQQLDREGEESIVLMFPSSLRLDIPREDVVLFVRDQLKSHIKKVEKIHRKFKAL